MTSGLKERIGEARCASQEQPCSGWQKGRSDTHVTKGPGEVQVAVATGSRAEGAGGTERGFGEVLEGWVGCAVRFSHVCSLLMVSHHETPTR